MNYSFHPEAEAEFFLAIEYYEDCEPGLGLDFATEVRSAIQRVLDLPSAWPVIEQDLRRCLIHRFPYGILYNVADEEIFILAVMHLHRDPDYWKQRT